MTAQAKPQIGVLTAEPVRTSPLLAWPRWVLRFCRQKPLGAFGGFIVVALVLIAVFAPWIAPYGYAEQVLTDRLQPPSRAHPFGTDNLGRDILSRVIYGARVSVVIGFGGMLIGTVFATTFGLISAYAGGAFDKFFQRLIDIWQSFPGLILLIALVQVIGQGQLQIMLALGILGTAGPSRVIRSAVLVVKANPYMEAGKTIGAGHRRLIRSYVLPNVLPIIIIGASLRVGGIILAESSLSFLGFGVAPPYPSWGQMLSYAGRNWMVHRPEIAFFPGLAITLAVFGFNVFGDALRDVLDPRLRGTR
jgi:peptide/nickel transport system permease protein